MYHNNIAEKSSTRIHHAPGGRSDMASILGGGAPEAKQAAPARRQSPFATDADTPQQAPTRQQPQTQSNIFSQPAPQAQAQSEPSRRYAANPRQSSSPWGTDADVPAPTKQAPKVQSPFATDADAPTQQPKRQQPQQSSPYAQDQPQGSTLHQGSNNPSVRLHAPAGGKSSMSSIMNWGH